ncbi:ephrin-B2-like isoform X1 [Haliotis rufescens]|uniref:ephrin-B2-like isoform X1 n=1 Tax=Haliotis rufescens TaxID=6454 RepID=UPI001EAFB737|nr:ephrin-B2-like isoform X1 [Haliotis rufescens]
MGFADSISTFVRRMPWFLQYYIILMPLAMSMVSVVDSGRKLPPIHWNSTNSMFIVSSRNNEIDIKLSDSIDIICPTYPPGTPTSKMEFYVIYMVGKQEYDSCIINNTTKAKLLIKCSRPMANPPLLYTLLIKQFQSIPGNPDFQPGKKYYFITTSGGEYHELNNQYEGACLTKNMRLILNVCCNGTQTAKPTPDNQTPRPVETTPRSMVTTRRPTTTRTTTPTTTTTTTLRTTPRTKKPTNTDSIPGNGNLPDENVIHANGPKNVGLISADASHRTIVNVGVLLMSVTIALLLR